MRKKDVKIAVLSIGVIIVTLCTVFYLYVTMSSPPILPDNITPTGAFHSEKTEGGWNVTIIAISKDVSEDKVKVMIYNENDTIILDKELTAIRDTGTDIQWHDTPPLHMLNKRDYFFISEDVAMEGYIFRLTVEGASIGVVTLR